MPVFLHFIATQPCFARIYLVKLSNLSVTSCQCIDYETSKCKYKESMSRRNLFHDENSYKSMGTFHNPFNLKAFASSKSSVDQTGILLDTSNLAEVLEKVSTYMFRTEIGGLVKVSVGRKDKKFVAFIEVSSLPQWSDGHGLVLSWGIFRSDSLCIMTPNSHTLPASSRSESFILTPFVEESLGKHELELEFDANQAPFYLSFLLYSSTNVVANSGIQTHKERKFCVPVGMGTGYPEPLGVSFFGDGSANFSLFSRNAERVVLCLYKEMENDSCLEIDLDSYVNRTGDIWHILMENVKQYTRYGYRCNGDIHSDRGSRFHFRHVLLDPYARTLGSFSPVQGKYISSMKVLGCLCESPIFDWEGDAHPSIAMEKLVVYRLNVRHFTEDKSSQLSNDIAGTFLGIATKLDHFKILGVNAILLEPIFPFDEHKGPYLPYHFFSPSKSYGPANHGESAILSMKEMVKKMHANGIEVLMEVVFTCTAEGKDGSYQTITFRGIDNSSYYIIDERSEMDSGNAFNCNDPVVQRLILDCLRYWVTEFHIDGFCFMNASSLARGMNGEYLTRPPLVEAIAFDPLLSKTKIIADYWSPFDMLSKETIFPHWKRWAEINLNFCSDIRNFLRGKARLSSLATRICGSGDIFLAGRVPSFSFNFVSRNSGLSLIDLVSFSNDDISSELSWNCGEEGPTRKIAVLETRVKQIRNFLFILFISLGVPVLNMGDECGQSNGGSLSYRERKPFNWNGLRTTFGVQVTQFIAFLNKLRVRRSDLFQRRHFFLEENIDWRGNDRFEPKWEDPSCKFLSMTLKTEEDEKPTEEDVEQLTSDVGDLFVAFNANGSSVSVVLPEIRKGMVWRRLVDTSLPYPGFFLEDSDIVTEQAPGLATYEIMSHTCVLFEGQVLQSSLPMAL